MNVDVFNCKYGLPTLGPTSVIKCQGWVLSLQNSGIFSLIHVINLYEVYKGLLTFKTNINDPLGLLSSYTFYGKHMPYRQKPPYLYHSKVLRNQRFEFETSLQL